MNGKYVCQYIYQEIIPTGASIKKRNNPSHSTRSGIYFFETEICKTRLYNTIALKQTKATTILVSEKISNNNTPIPSCPPYSTYKWLFRID